MQVTIIDYKAGNVKSVQNALERLGVNVVLSSDIEVINKAEKVIFPGVGHATFAMQSLKNTGLDKIIPKLTQPVLGICLGFQLMCAHSEEGNTRGLNIFDAKVKVFPESEFKVPHMGWNNVNADENPLFKDVEKSFFYHVHSYYVESNSAQIASCNYVLPFATAVQKNNFYGVQFHPEKSAKAGETLLKNFLNL